MSRRKLLSILLWVWLLAVPILAGYIVTNTQGLVRSVPYSFAEGDVIRVNRYIANATVGYTLEQDFVFDNDSESVIVSDLNFTTAVTDITLVTVYFDFNITGKFDKGVSKFVVEWNYIGTGNVTNVYLNYYDTYDVPAVDSWLLVENGVEENASYSYLPETFESLRLQDAKMIRLNIQYTDSVNYPQTGDYVEVKLVAYYRDTLLTQDQLVGFVIGGFAVLNFIFAIAMTPVWNPLQSSKNAYVKKKKYKKRFYRRRR